MSETEQKKETPTPTDPKVTALWDRLTTKAADRNLNLFEYLIGSDEYTFKGTTYKFKPVTWKTKSVVDKLREAAPTLDNGSTEYAMNVRERACILIEGMTPEIFDEGDYNTLENIVSAWSVRAISSGFRGEEQSVPGVL